jgi:2-succinyl-5-enolpyruvyl-6-hydroxy-3-cyclohexene-1-carboxylate synthase
VRVHANRGTNGIDGTIASAVGEALAWPHGPSLALLGDLTFLHDLDGLAAAAQLAAADRLPRGLTLVVVDNGGGGIFEHLPIRQHADAFERLFLTPQRADLAPLCQAFGIPHRRVDNLAEASAAVAERLEQAGLGVVQVIVDRDASVSTHREVWAQVAIQLAAARLKDAP